jgi:S1-C subfamily serine protease
VAFVDADSPAARGGLRPLDAILRINDRPIRTLDDFERALLDARESASLLVERRDVATPITLTLTLAP